MLRSVVFLRGGAFPHEWVLAFHRGSPSAGTVQCHHRAGSSIPHEWVLGILQSSPIAGIHMHVPVVLVHQLLTDISSLSVDALWGRVSADELQCLGW